MYAIKTHGVGRPVSFRQILPGWSIDESEVFTVDSLPHRPVLAEDGASLREATDLEWMPWTTRIAATRYENEIAGTTFTHSDGNTYGIATDRQSQGLTTGAAVQARRAQEAGNTDWSKRWKTGQGFLTMSADDILAMGDAVDAHVQACFDREAELAAMVADGTITESDLESGWP